VAKRPDLIARNYHLRHRQVRAEVERRLAAAYDRVREDDIRASYAAFVLVAARTIGAAQGSLQTLTRAYIRGVGGFEPAPTPKAVGRSEAGTMTEALTGIMPFILGAIARGESPQTALTIGASYVDRMADNELTRVVDQEIEAQVKTQRVTGWIGTTFGSVDECASNEGPHTFDEEMYRHPFCRCQRDLIFEDVEYTVPQINVRP